MIIVRRHNERGTSDHGWLKSRHTFSFADYYDPKYMGFGPLRVINEDIVLPGHGFSRHAHADMEIISYVVSGTLEHHDSIGNGSLIRPGEIQIMSAGTGIEHSEFNHSRSEPLHFLQIWVRPDKLGLVPRYQQKAIIKSDNAWTLLAASRSQEGAVLIHQDVAIYAGYFNAGQKLSYSFAPERAGWLQIIKGSVKLNNQVLGEGDGAGIYDSNIAIISEEDAECLLFDLKK